jgi:hypothetical protein
LRRSESVTDEEARTIGRNKMAEAKKKDTVAAN